VDVPSGFRLINRRSWSVDIEMGVMEIVLTDDIYIFISSVTQNENAIGRADAESKPWTTRSLVLDDAKSNSSCISVWCSQGINTQGPRGTS
jgi:hypothetical protein